VQRRRDSQAASRLMRKLLKKRGFAPKLLVTDKLHSCGSAFRPFRRGCRALDLVQMPAIARSRATLAQPSRDRGTELSTYRGADSRRADVFLACYRNVWISGGKLGFGYGHSSLEAKRGDWAALMPPCDVCRGLPA
jgi:hypothetical protein